MKMENKSNYTPIMKEIFGGDKSFRLGLFASSTGGKSHIISEMFCNPAWGLMEKFPVDRIYLISPTVSFDDSYDKIIKCLEDHSTEEHEFDREK